MFKKKKKKSSFEGITKLQPLDFPSKVISVWSEAIIGNKQCQEILLKSEFKALGIFVYALNLKDDAREWLMVNGYAHLMAMINAVEGNMDALRWLELNKFDILYHMALGGDGDKDAIKWLVKNGHQDMALITKQIEHIKDLIEMENNDVHKIRAE